jgi:hypothetical protein
MSAALASSAMGERAAQCVAVEGEQRAIAATEPVATGVKLSQKCHIDDGDATIGLVEESASPDDVASDLAVDHADGDERHWRADAVAFLDASGGEHGRVH